MSESPHPHRRWALIGLGFLGILEAIALLLAARWLEDMTEGQIKDLVIALTILIPLISTGFGFAYFSYRWAYLGFAEASAERENNREFKSLDKDLPESAKQIFVSISKSEYSSNLSEAISAIANSTKPWASDAKFLMDLLGTKGLIANGVYGSSLFMTDKGVLYALWLRKAKL